MTAIQILEKLGADASLNPGTMSDEDKNKITQLAEATPLFNATLIHTSPDEDEDENQDEDEEAPDENSEN